MTLFKTIDNGNCKTLTNCI